MRAEMMMNMNCCCCAMPQIYYAIDNYRDKKQDITHDQVQKYKQNLRKK